MEMRNGHVSVPVPSKSQPMRVFNDGGDDLGLEHSSGTLDTYV